MEFSAREMIRAVEAQAASAALSGGISVKPARTPRLTDRAMTLMGQPVAAAWSPVVVAGIYRMVEFALVALTGFAVYGVYLAGELGFSWPYLIATLGVASLSVVAFQAVDSYHVAAFRTHVKQLTKVAAAFTVVFLLLLAVIFFAKLEGMFSRVWLIGFFGFGLCILFTGRMMLRQLVRSWTAEGRLRRRAVVVGGGEIGEGLLAQLARQPDSDVEVLGVFDDRQDDRSPESTTGYPKLGEVEDLVTFARNTRIDLVIFSLPITAENRILDMLKKLWVLPLDIRLSAHSSNLRFRPRSYSYIGNVPVLDVFDKPIADWDVVMKLAFDKIVGTLALIALAPVFLVTAAAVKLESKGPVFFRQKRYGFNNELIEVWKFRSMYTDMSDATAARLVTKDDPRVTKVGRIIRKTSIDELPQLFNVVLFGNLSLVGPRPHAVHAKAENRLYDQAVDGYFARHKVKPGITGWAQVNGWRGETDTQDKIQKRVEHDLYYIENWSILFDLYILAITPWSLVTKREGAY